MRRGKAWTSLEDISLEQFFRNISLEIKTLEDKNMHSRQLKMWSMISPKFAILIA